MTRPRGPGLAGLGGALATAGWTPARLARAIGVTPGYLAGVRVGRTPLPAWWPDRLCSLLGCTPYQLYGLVPCSPQKGGSSDADTHPAPDTQQQAGAMSGSPV